VALKALLAGQVESQAMNLGTGNGRSVREVVDTARRITKSPFRVIEAPRRAGDPPVLFAAVDRAKKMLGWTAESSSLELMIASAWDWHRRRFGDR
jgi:UDP-glucose 4-epimerase